MGNTRFVSVVFPLALPRLYSYVLPDEMQDNVSIGCRVEVALKNKVYSAIVIAVSDKAEEGVVPKPIISVIDEEPCVSETQLNLWVWMARYYCCTIGEVMDAGMPSALKLHSETLFVKSEWADETDVSELTNDEYLVTEALTLRNELTLDQIKNILNKKSIYPLIRSLFNKNILSIKEQLHEKFKPRKIKVAQFTNAFQNEEELNHAFDLVGKSELQNKALLTLIDLSEKNKKIPISDVKKNANVPLHALKALEKKGIIYIEEISISRLGTELPDIIDLPPLNEGQRLALDNIYKAFEEHKPVLIHGVTGSGKTRIYKELIHDALVRGKQVLYLLPEIALTSQIVDRLYKSFGNDILLYHSKMNDNERVEVWNESLKGKKLILAARSGIFLPFTNLDLIIVDEEHDASYKQDAPNPHYNARDVALYMAYQMKCNVILGSATPSVESYYNAQKGLIELVELKYRFGSVSLPEVEIIDLVYERRTHRYKAVISVPLQKEIARVLALKKQVILFQNRRGFVPTVQCKNCGWTASCINCDVNLTLHKFVNELSCHYCSHKQKNPVNCPDCGSADLSETGSGTEKIEHTVRERFPSVSIGRLDFDTTRTKSAQDKIINDFSKGEIDILVGTQMVTKGFDFDHVNLVGVVDADALIRFPDFRAVERTFQLITQVAGRAGRRADRGKVMIQTYSATHPIINDIIHNDYLSFFKRELAERKQFLFPPFVRLIDIEVSHVSLEKTVHAAHLLGKHLHDVIGDRVRGPITPAITRIRNRYIRHIMLKLEKDDKLIFNTKLLLLKLKETLTNDKDLRGLRIKIDVDPY